MITCGSRNPKTEDVPAIFKPGRPFFRLCISSVFSANLFVILYLSTPQFKSFRMKI